MLKPGVTKYHSIEEMDAAQRAALAGKRVLIFGSRDYPHPDEVAEYVMGLPEGTTVVSGVAAGVDSWAAHVADALGLKVETYPANWDRHGRSAGPIRNAEMVATRPDFARGFWYRYSNGTGDCIAKLHKAGIPMQFSIPGDPAKRAKESL